MAGFLVSTTGYSNRHTPIPHQGVGALSTPTPHPHAHTSTPPPPPHPHAHQGVGVLPCDTKISVTTPLYMRMNRSYINRINTQAPSAKEPTMTTATTLTTTTLNIIKAMRKWQKWSDAINGTPDGWVPLQLLGMSEQEVDALYEAKVIDVLDDGGVLICKFQ